MFTKREAAKKTFIKELLTQDISIARVLGDVVFKFLGENNYGFVVVDDGTETIRASIFDSSKISNINVGDIVDVIGRVKDYEGEKYIAIEIIKKIENPNWEILRKLEILNKEKEKDNEMNIVEEKIEDPEKVIMSCFEKKDELSIQELKNLTQFDEDMIKETVKKLMLDGEIFEPRPGRLKLI